MSTWKVEAWTPPRAGRTPTYFETVGSYFGEDDAFDAAYRFLEQARSKRWWKPGAYLKILGPGFQHVVTQEDDAQAHQREAARYARRFGLKAGEALRLIEHPRRAEILDELFSWRESVGLPEESSPLSRGYLLELIDSERFERNAGVYVVSATIAEANHHTVTLKERFSSLEKALARAVELRDSSRPEGGPGRRSVIFVDRQRRGSARDLHLQFGADERTWGLVHTSNEAAEILGAEVFRQVGPAGPDGPALPPGFEGFGDEVFEENAKRAIRYAPLTPPVGQRELLVDREGVEWIVIPHSRLVEADGERYDREWVEQRRGPLQPKLSTNMPRRYERNRSALDAARKLRRTFHDKEPEHETPVPWRWPSELQEIGVCEAVMYASNKWQKNPKDVIDYKHVAEGPQRILVQPGFLQDFKTGRALPTVGPVHELNDMPDAFAVLDKILGVQVQLYTGSDAAPQPSGEFYQIDIANAHLGAGVHPVTGQTFLIVYTSQGVHCLIVGDELAVEKDGITG